METNPTPFNKRKRYTAEKVNLPTLLLITIQKQGLTQIKRYMLISWLENHSKSNLGTLLNCPGVHLS